MKTTTRLLSAALAISLVFTGCKQNTDSQQQGAGTSLKNYGAVVTVEDIKNAYDYEDGTELMPLYNVEQTEEFTFTFNFSDYEHDIDLFDYVSVHTDAKCEEASSIYYTIDLEVAEDNSTTTLTVSPMDPVLATDSQNKDDIYNDISTWGNAPIYYLAVHYDMQAETPVKLEKPIIIPFTVKSDTNAPTARGVVDENGVFSIQWDEVEGAEKYIIYNLHVSSHKTGVDNHAIDGSKIGYDFGRNTSLEEQLYLQKDGESDDCVYDDFGKVEIEDFTTGKILNFGQNYHVYGEYFVTAVVDGKESVLSNPVATADLRIPYKVVEESEIQARYPTPADFPAEVEVLNIDGTTSTRKVFYERTHVDFYEFNWDEYDYYIEGTDMHGHVGFDDDIGTPPQETGASAETGNAVPEDNVDKIPDNTLETIIPTDDGSSYENTPLVEAQTDNTQNHIENGNNAEVANAPADVYVNADSAEEEWLALNLIQGNTDISVEAFPSLQDPYTLTDVFYKVYYQNPYILGVNSFEYDYSTMTFKVNYSYDKETIAAKQDEINKKAEEIVSKLITPDMTTEQKIDAIYSYLVNNAVYDQEALEAAKENGFTKSANFEHEDAYNTYGILVEGEGVCMSYAYAFRLLCDLSGVECIVTTGYLNGTLPHTWNLVKINDEWYEIDCTNNAVTTGIPYYLYNSNSSLAETAGYTKDNMFAIDTDIAMYSGDDESLEYYTANGLCPETMDEYKQIITANVTADTELFIVRWQGELDTKEFNHAVVLAFNELGIEDKLETLKYSANGGFLVLIMNKD